MVLYLRTFAPLTSKIWSFFPTQDETSEEVSYETLMAQYDQVAVLYDQLDAMNVPDDAALLHSSFSLVTLDISGWYLNSANAFFYGDNGYFTIAGYAGSNALDRYYAEYLPLREELLDDYQLSATEVGFKD